MVKSSFTIIVKAFCLSGQLVFLYATSHFKTDKVLEKGDLIQGLILNNFNANELEGWQVYKNISSIKMENFYLGDKKSDISNKNTPKDYRLGYFKSKLYNLLRDKDKKKKKTFT